MTAPTFLEDSDSRYSGLDDDGWGGWDSHVGFVMALPCSVLTGAKPLRAIVQYGHGLFDDRSELLESWLLQLAERRGWALVAADWRGLTRFDLPVLGRALLAMPHVSLYYSFIYSFIRLFVCLLCSTHLE